MLGKFLKNFIILMLYWVFVGQVRSGTSLDVTPSVVSLTIPSGRLDFRYLNVVNLDVTSLSISSDIDSTWTFLFPSEFQLSPRETKRIMAIFFIPRGEDPRRKGQIVFQSEDRKKQTTLQVVVSGPPSEVPLYTREEQEEKSYLLESEISKIETIDEKLAQLLREEARRLREEIREKDALIASLKEENMKHQELQTAALSGISYEGIREALIPLYEKLVETLAEEIESREVEVTWQGNELLVTVPGRIAFLSGQCYPRQLCCRIVEKFGAVVKDYLNPKKWIIVKGHADAVPIGRSLRGRYPSNWEISVARAASVARILEQDIGIEGKYVSPIGYSYHHPIADNGTVAGRALNRRIEIVISAKENLL